MRISEWKWFSIPGEAAVHFRESSGSGAGATSRVCLVLVRGALAQMNHFHVRCVAIGRLCFMFDAPWPFFAQPKHMHTPLISAVAAHYTRT